MQSARIWFQQTSQPVTLAFVKKFFEKLGVQFEEVEWTLGTFTVPQLYVTQPVPFLIQLNDDEYVLEEAAEFAASEDLPHNIRTKLPASNARFEIGDTSENTNLSDKGITVFAGWTSFDPSHPKALALLQRLAAEVNGVFEDNVHGMWSFE